MNLNELFPRRWRRAGRGVRRHTPEGSNRQRLRKSKSRRRDAIAKASRRRNRRAS